MRYIIGLGVGFNQHGESIGDPDTLLARVANWACFRFGGCFIQHGNGFWKSPEGQIVAEPGVTITIDTPVSETESVHAFAEFIRDLFDQHSVIVTAIEASVRFVEKS